MPPPRPRPDALCHRVFRGTTAVGSGLLTTDDLRGPNWRRLFPDVYADARLEITHTVRARTTARLLLPHAVLSGASAAVLWGLTDLAGPRDDVEVTVAPGAARGAAPGVVVRRRVLPDRHVRPVAGVRATAPETTALELAARLPLDDAVALLDRFVAARLTTLGTLRAEAAELTGRGCRRALVAADLADGLAASPQEPGCGCCCTGRRCRARSPSTGSGRPDGSSPDWTSPGPRTGWAWSTRAPGTPPGSPRTAGGSRHCRRPGGGCCS